MPPIDNQYKIRNQEFLQEYAQRPGVKTIFNGVMYRVINKGNGPKPSPKSFISVYYTGKLINGKEFDKTQKDALRHSASMNLSQGGLPHCVRCLRAHAGK